jgi:hypothetical protein
MTELEDSYSNYQGHALRGLHSRRIQIDQIWAFVEAKTKQATKMP